MVNAIFSGKRFMALHAPGVFSSLLRLQYRELSRDSVRMIGRSGSIRTNGRISEIPDRTDENTGVAGRWGRNFLAGIMYSLF
jgi:hypothetical protein